MRSSRNLLNLPLWLIDLDEGSYGIKGNRKEKALVTEPGPGGLVTYYLSRGFRFNHDYTIGKTMLVRGRG